MAQCRDCGGYFTWAQCDGKWVLLEPLGADVDLPKKYTDEHGHLRADHRDRHGEGAPLTVTRLKRPLPPDPPPLDEGPLAYLHKRQVEEESIADDLLDRLSPGSAAHEDLMDSLNPLRADT